MNEKLEIKIQEKLEAFIENKLIPIKESILANASDIERIRLSHKERMLNLGKSVNNLANELSMEQEKLKNENRVLNNSLLHCELKLSSLDEKLEYLEELKACMNVLISHISILEQRSKKFTDKFKFGRFKFKSIDEENIRALNQRQIFVLNED